jgi:succinoglycan biosynthesis transport protein ExoP
VDEPSKIQRYHPAPVVRERPGSEQPGSYDTLEMEGAPDLLVYWRVIRKRQWTILVIFAVIFSVVLIGTLRQKPVYRAVALLEIQKENPELVSVQDLFQLESVTDNYLETQYKVLKSESLARRVIEQLQLDRLEEFNPKGGWFSSGSQQTPGRGGEAFSALGAPAVSRPPTVQKVLERYQKSLSIEPVRRSRLVQVSFESTDAELAARVVNTLSSNYIEQNLEARWEATQKASEWLSGQLFNLKANLEKSEEALQRYARERGLLFLESEQGNAENIVNQRLRQLQEALTKAQEIRYQKEALYRLVELGDYASLPGVFDSRLMQDLTVRLAELKRDHALQSTTFTEDYPKVKQIQSQIDEIEAVLERERSRAAKLITNEYLAAVRNENLLRREFEEQEQQANLVAERSVQYNILKREVESNRQLYEGLLQRLKEAGVSAGLKASNVRIVDPAEPPEKPAKPRPLLNMTLAIVLGLGLGVGAAFFQEYLDNTLKTAEDVERFLHAPALALIPSVESLNGRRGVYGVYGYGRRKWLSARTAAPTSLPSGSASVQAGWYRIDSLTDETSILAEAFRSLRTSVLLSTANRPPRSVIITSSQPGEGKTTVSINLSISLVQLGQRVLLIDGDLRRPCIHKALEIADIEGLVTYLTGQKDWREVVRRSSVERLDALVCGPVPPNPAELLSSDRMRGLISEASNEYDFVVVDSPPLLSVADTRILMTLAEGTVLVVKGGATPRELARRATVQINNVGSHLIGVVLNNLAFPGEDYNYYGYDRYGYSYPQADIAQNS